MQSCTLLFTYKTIVSGRITFLFQRRNHTVIFFVFEKEKNIQKNNNTSSSFTFFPRIQESVIDIHKNCDDFLFFSPFYFYPTDITSSKSVFKTAQAKKNFIALTNKNDNSGKLFIMQQIFSNYRQTRCCSWNLFAFIPSQMY